MQFVAYVYEVCDEKYVQNASLIHYNGCSDKDKKNMEVPDCKVELGVVNAPDSA